MKTAGPSPESAKP